MSSTLERGTPAIVKMAQNSGESLLKDGGSVKYCRDSRGEVIRNGLKIFLRFRCHESPGMADDILPLSWTLDLLFRLLLAYSIVLSSS